MHEVDIAIVGAGAAGLAAAEVVSASGLSTIATASSYRSARPAPAWLPYASGSSTTRASSRGSFLPAGRCQFSIRSRSTASYSAAGRSGCGSPAASSAHSIDSIRGLANICARCGVPSRALRSASRSGAARTSAAAAIIRSGKGIRCCPRFASRYCTSIVRSMTGSDTGIHRIAAMSRCSIS